MKHIDLSRVIMTNYVEKESSGDKSDQACFMVQGIDSLEVISDTQLDDCASSSCDDKHHISLISYQILMIQESL